MIDTPTFVVSTGRSGSTLVSNMVRLHPAVLSLSDLFVSLLPDAFPAPEVSGPELWDVLSRPRRRDTLMLRLGIVEREILYRPGPGARFSAESGVPPILMVALPHLVDDPESLYDELGGWLLGRGRRPIGEQYRRTFAWLAARLGHEVVVERSGSSLDWVDDLIDHFPGARFVHLYRDGRDCAISMSRHNLFKLTVIGQRLRWRIGVDPFISEETPRTPPPRALRPFLPETFDADRFHRLEVPFEESGRMWSRMVRQGVERLRRLPDGRVMDLCYERLLADPAPELRRLAAFTGIDADEAWVARASTLVRPTPPRWEALPEDARRRLADACDDGMRILGYAGYASP